jgi:hypothetical protein
MESLNTSLNTTIDVLNKDGFVVLDHPEFRIDMTPEEARQLAKLLTKHAHFAAPDRDAKVARTRGRLQ